jgi:hypothetical protein
LRRGQKVWGEMKFSFFMGLIPFLVLKFDFVSARDLTRSRQNLSGQNLRLSLDQYINASENNSDQNIFLDLNKTYTIAGSQQLKMNLNLNWSQNENFLYAHVNDFYFNLGEQDRSLVLGFKNLSWSQSLNFFNSPEWQQQLERYKLNPQTGGNLGVFYSYLGEQREIDLQYSPYFLPTRGPDINFENGQVLSQNPWFLAPPEQIPFEGDTFSTNYELKNPDMMDLLQQQTFAFKVKPYKNEKFDISLAYANKPSPRLVTDVDFKADVSDPTVPIDVFVRPRAVRHQPSQLEMSYKLKSRSNIKSKVYFSYLNENFETQTESSLGQTYIQPNDQSVVSLFYMFEQKNYVFKFGAINRQGGGSKAIGELASTLVNQNLNYIYDQALKLDFTYFKAWGWSLNSSVSYDFAQRGVLTSGSLQRRVSQAILNIGFEALEPINATDESSFIYQYRNLDRIWAGVSYVF